MVESMIPSLATLPSLGLFFVIIIASYVFEDGAIALAAFVAVESVLAWHTALLAIFLGIASGDIALFLLGRYARRYRRLRARLLMLKGVRDARHLLRRHAFLNLFLIRFIPGLRTVTYSLSGFLFIPFRTFLLSVGIATACWTGVIFWGAFTIEHSEWLAEKQLTGWAFAIAVIALVLMNRFLRRRALLTPAKGSV
ncbi:MULTISPECIES: DedA family protein [unclassified Salinivibrio]|uniref:DedA family protein n=1 Tax=unclassified Salinivibrio TaxID=2636825 RepID=UPI00128BF4D0|nr:MULTISPECIES: VTT domain-containing protein [unclassified Salinivibrio]MPS30901.1 DedA family protein [Salinivibrio sp. VYel7]MPX89558.1 DedA family protein [Salinivibrio sp. VYel1]MPX92302.1 DedA family protein [Salinivibrio sp. VYel9]MPX97122.1 DedA family protein [Salinivibrio sp. VYel6]MPX98534.1 DedA family protein [Salinivibrio sp. VYel4]